MASSRRAFVGQLASLAAVGALKPAAATENLAVRIVNTEGISSTILQSAMQSVGYLKALGVDASFETVADGNKIIAALLGGDSDICIFSGFGQVLSAIEKGGALKVLAGSLITPPHVVYAKNPAIRTVKDLEGRAVGVGPIGSLLDQMMVALLKSKGVDPAKVTFANVGNAGDVFRAIVAGKVDAGPADFDYFRPGLGVHALQDGQIGKELPEFTFQASYASTRAIAQKRDALVRTLAAYGRLYRYVSSPAGKGAYLAAAVAALGANSSHEAEAQWEFVQSRHAYDVDLVLSKGRVDYAQRLNLASGSQRRIVPYEQIVDVSIARDALRLLQRS